MDQVLALGEESFGNTPMANANIGAWPDVLPVINDTHRVYCSWVNGNENFYIRGNTAALNVALKNFALIDAESLTVILRPAPGSVNSFRSDQTFVFNWQLHLLGGIAKHMSTRDQGSNVWNPDPELIIYVGDKILLNSSEIPENLNVLQLVDLKQRCAKGLNSTHTDVRGWNCEALASLDSYDEASMLKITSMLEDSDDWAKLNAVGALSEFSVHRTSVLNSLQAVNTNDERLKERIEFSLKKINVADVPDDARKSHQSLLRAISRFVQARRDSS